ncbi:hypothetical protein ACVWW4_003779 [Bradyrhizobium sp. LB7.1]
MLHASWPVAKRGWAAEFVALATDVVLLDQKSLRAGSACEVDAMVRLSAFAESTAPNPAVLKVVMLVGLGTAGRLVGDEAKTPHGPAQLLSGR